MNAFEKNLRSPREVAVDIVRVLQQAGYVAYLAGGCVRDALLGRVPKDYDVATNAMPDQVRGLFRYSRYVGESFGVVLIRRYGCSVDVATFRTEWGYKDGRRPTHVHFSDAQHDAQRRDFTINGLFEDPLAQEGVERIIDYVGGQQDLQDKTLRAIGDPDQRFSEDYLRMLRAVRITARLGFEIESNTAKAIRTNAQLLGEISRERIGQEVMWMLQSTDTPGNPQNPQNPQGSVSSSQASGISQPAQAIKLLQSLKLDGPVLDEQPMALPAVTVANLPSDTAYSTVLVAWMLDRHWFNTKSTNKDHAQQVQGFTQAVKGFINEAAQPIIARWRRALCLSNEHGHGLRGTLNLLPRGLSWPELGLAARKRLLADRLWPQVFKLLGAMTHADGVKHLLPTLTSESQKLLALGVAPQPWVNGNDLIALGVKPGPQLGRRLQAAYDAQLEGRFASRQEVLDWQKKTVSEPCL